MVDSSIVGAGTYASNKPVTVPATGQGEYSIQSVAAHNAASRVRSGGASLDVTAKAAVEEAEALGRMGGVVVLDPNGTIATPLHGLGDSSGIRDAGRSQARSNLRSRGRTHIICRSTTVQIGDSFTIRS